MVVVASSNGRVGTGEAMRVLRLGGSALTAVETAIKLVEDNPEDHTVGLSGADPNGVCWAGRKSGRWAALAPTA